MTLDLDRLLSHRQEMAVMKEVIKGLGKPKLSKHDRNLLSSMDLKTSQQSSVAQQRGEKITVEQLTNSAPSPVVFTKERNIKFSSVK